MESKTTFDQRFPNRDGKKSQLEETSVAKKVPDLFEKSPRRKRRLDPVAIAEEMGVDPFKILLAFAGNDKEFLEISADDEIKLETRLKAAVEAAGYMAPKLKAVEHVAEGGNKVEHKTVIVLPSNSRDDDSVKATEDFLNIADQNVIEVILPDEHDQDDGYVVEENEQPQR